MGAVLIYLTRSPPLPSTAVALVQHIGKLAKGFLGTLLVLRTMVFTTLLRQVGLHYRMLVSQLVTSALRDVDTDLLSYVDADFANSIDDMYSFCVEVLSAGSPVHSLLLLLVQWSQSIWLFLKKFYS